jgi:hypothetical protein
MRQLDTIRLFFHNRALSGSGFRREYSLVSPHNTGNDKKFKHSAAPSNLCNILNMLLPTLARVFRIKKELEKADIE